MGKMEGVWEREKTLEIRHVRALPMAWALVLRCSNTVFPLPLVGWQHRGSKTGITGVGLVGTISEWVRVKCG
jgi:hypothetical protein